MGRGYPNDSIAENGQNPETSHSSSSEKPSANTDVKNSKGVNNNNEDNNRELKIRRNMKVTIIPIVIGALGKFTKGLVQGLEDWEIRGQVETIQTRVLLRLARILRRVLET